MENTTEVGEKELEKRVEIQSNTGVNFDPELIVTRATARDYGNDIPVGDKLETGELPDGTFVFIVKTERVQRGYKVTYATYTRNGFYRGVDTIEVHEIEKVSQDPLKELKYIDDIFRAPSGTLMRLELKDQEPIFTRLVDAQKHGRGGSIRYEDPTIPGSEEATKKVSLSDIQGIKLYR